jgi:hypothetical protein
MKRSKEMQLDRFDEFPSYKGGHTMLYGGYVYEFCPGHHLQNQWGWVAQHRMIGEDIVGRRLVQDDDPDLRECVHHIDDCRTNNALENLQVMTFSAHRSHHTKHMNHVRIAWLTAELVQEALVGRTIKQAAEHLGVDHNTLRNRFREVLMPRMRRLPHRNFDDPGLVKQARKYAKDSKVALKEAARLIGCSVVTLIKTCRRHRIRWVHKQRPGRPPKNASPQA